jgi:hypothetical protein
MLHVVPHLLVIKSEAVYCVHSLFLCNFICCEPKFFLAVYSSGSFNTSSSFRETENRAMVEFSKLLSHSPIVFTPLLHKLAVIIPRSLETYVFRMAPTPFIGITFTVTLPFFLTDVCKKCYSLVMQHVITRLQ